MTSFPGIQAIVTDIEGTTSSISFVHDVLFPYARQHIAQYIKDHTPELTYILDMVAAESGKSNISAEEAIAIFYKWIDEDRKVTPLKAIQGRIWAEGYARKAFKGHVFSDVPGCLRRWSESGIRLFVYSSGSIEAQKQIFGYSEHGDLTGFFEGYFDTTTGGKKDHQSYGKISAVIGVAPQNILFLSDHPEELDAAAAAGFQALALLRPGNSFDIGSRAFVRTFDDIEFS